MANSGSETGIVRTRDELSVVCVTADGPLLVRGPIRLSTSTAKRSPRAAGCARSAGAAGPRGSRSATARTRSCPSARGPRGHPPPQHPRRIRRSTDDLAPVGTASAGEPQTYRCPCEGGSLHDPDGSQQRRQPVEDPPTVVTEPTDARHERRARSGDGEPARSEPSEHDHGGSGREEGCQTVRPRPVVVGLPRTLKPRTERLPVKQAIFAELETAAPRNAHPRQQHFGHSDRQDRGEG